MVRLVKPYTRNWNLSINFDNDNAEEKTQAIDNLIDNINSQQWKAYEDGIRDGKLYGFLQGIALGLAVVALMIYGKRGGGRGIP